MKTHELLVAGVTIIGGSGMLGRAWRELLTRRNIDFDAPAHAELDLADASSIARHVAGVRKLVVNCAAWTDVDGAEKDEAGATRLNGDAVGALARRCKRVGATLVHYGTDYIFNGVGTRPYRVDEPTAPLNAYGRGKLVGERLLLESGCRFLHARTSWLYAPWGKNFVRTIAKFAKERPVLKVVNDQRGRPTSSEHLAAATLSLLERDATGIYHVTDGGECTWFDFAVRIAAFANPSCKVEPCTTAEFPRPAKRPAYSVLDLAKTEALIGPMPDWTANLDDVLRRLE